LLLRRLSLCVAKNLAWLNCLLVAGCSRKAQGSGYGTVQDERMSGWFRIAR
jgi:hypothetical protein